MREDATPGRDERFSPSYAELPPREIYVKNGSSRTPISEATPAVANVTSRSSTSIPEPELAHGAKSMAAKHFTFEGLTPVSTVDDTREEGAGAPTSSPTKTNDSRENSNNTGEEASSPLTAEEEKKEEGKEGLEESGNEEIQHKTSSVQEKIAAWEKTTAKWSKSEDEVPFDEEPMAHLSKSCSTQEEHDELKVEERVDETAVEEERGSEQPNKVDCDLMNEKTERPKKEDTNLSNEKNEQPIKEDADLSNEKNEQSDKEDADLTEKDQQPNKKDNELPNENKEISKEKLTIDGNDYQIATTDGCTHPTSTKSDSHLVLAHDNHASSALLQDTPKESKSLFDDEDDYNYDEIIVAPSDEMEARACNHPNGPVVTGCPDDFCKRLSMSSDDWRKMFSL